jgi:hypothetical protein
LGGTAEQAQLAAAAIITAATVAIILNVMSHLPHHLSRFRSHLRYANHQKRVWLKATLALSGRTNNGKFLSEIIFMKTVSKLQHTKEMKIYI